MAWYWWVLIAVALIIIVPIIDGRRLMRRMQADQAARYAHMMTGPVETFLYHASWTEDGRGCTFYRVNDEIHWRYDAGVVPDLNNMMMVDLELTALQLRLGEPVSNPYWEDQARELNEQRRRDRPQAR